MLIDRGEVDRLIRSRRAVVAIIAATLALGGAASAVGVLASEGSGGGEPLPNPPSADQLDSIKNTILQVASLDGEQNPYGAVLFETTRKIAMPLIDEGNQLGDTQDQGVYLVRFRGTFKDHDYSPPVTSKLPPPTYTSIVLEIDPTTMHSIAYALDREPPDLSNLGSGVPIDLTTS